MKYFTLAALAASAQAVRFLGHEGRLQFLNELIMTRDDVPEYGEIPASYTGGLGGGVEYKRNIPDRFADENDDRLMNSLIKNYAREIKIDGQLTGRYMLNHDDALAAAKEVAQNHGKFDTVDGNGGALQNFEDTWNHFDVNHDGLIEVERMPQFLRYMLGNALDISLQ